MSNERLMLDVGQANELKLAFRRGNWTNKEIKVLLEGDMLTRVREVILGRSEIKPIEHFVDFNADPMIPDGWSVVEHKRGGLMKWDPSKVKLHLSENQQGSGHIEGNELRKELESQSIYNANLLDFYLAHPELIPEEWKGKVVCFWGTIYRNSGGRSCVRFLSSDGGQWHWSYGWLGND
ncbi:MAG: hypothetical protein HZA35_03130 [Parcubacteria group bacterium]|nr:hypothetical protein [Parcubacteria group bacterium]